MSAKPISLSGYYAKFTQKQTTHPQLKPNPKPKPTPQSKPKPTTEVSATSNPQEQKEQKVALLIGIEYVKYAKQKITERLPGCHQDVAEIYRMLITKYGFKDVDIKVLSDTGLHGHINPTYDGIRAAFKWFKQKGKSGCHNLFLYYSGHGTQTRDKNKDEIDGHDEAIVPADYIEKGIIIDDIIAHDLLEQLPGKCRIVSVFDSCNSGTVMDLPFRYESGKMLLSSIINTGVAIEADVISLSGCHDPQTSASAFSMDRKKEWRGAMTFCLQKVLESKNYKGKCEEILLGVRDELKKRNFAQVPQLCFSRNDKASTKAFL